MALEFVSSIKKSSLEMTFLLDFYFFISHTKISSTNSNFYLPLFILAQYRLFFLRNKVV